MTVKTKNLKALKNLAIKISVMKYNAKQPPKVLKML